MINQSSLRFYCIKKSTVLNESSKISSNSLNHEHILESSVFTSNKISLPLSDAQAIDEDWNLVGSKKLNKILKHSTQIPPSSITQSKYRSLLQLCKLEVFIPTFHTIQFSHKLIHDLNGLPWTIESTKEIIRPFNFLHLQFNSKIIVTHNNLLNLTSIATCSFTSCPELICNLPFKITLPRQIPPAYSILVNQILRD